MYVFRRWMVCCWLLAFRKRLVWTKISRAGSALGTFAGVQSQNCLEYRHLSASLKYAASIDAL